MAGKVQNMNKLLKINGNAKMNRSAENPATAHTHSRCGALKGENYE